MADFISKSLAPDADGLACYEYLANNIESFSIEDLTALIDRMIEVDLNGQFSASAARYLQAIDPTSHADSISRLVAATIDKDREHRYIADLMTAVYGSDYADRAEQLVQTDNNFRRLYKRLYPDVNSL